MNDPRRVEAALAHNLREWRARRGWTQADLAARAGLSKGMLVQIEQSQTNPSIATLCKLANALGVALPRLVEVADEPVIRRVAREDVAWLWHGRGRNSAAGLVGGIEVPIPVELWEWRMGPSDTYEAIAHPPGTREIVYALEGQVRVAVEGVETILGAGESAVFQADRPHRYAAAGRRSARFVMVVVEPLVVPGAGAPRTGGPRRRQRGGSGPGQAGEARWPEGEKGEGRRHKAEGRRQKAESTRLKAQGRTFRLRSAAACGLVTRFETDAASKSTSATSRPTSSTSSASAPPWDARLDAGAGGGAERGVTGTARSRARSRNDRDHHVAGFPRRHLSHHSSRPPGRPSSRCSGRRRGRPCP